VDGQLIFKNIPKKILLKQNRNLKKRKDRISGQITNSIWLFDQIFAI